MRKLSICLMMMALANFIASPVIWAAPAGNKTLNVSASISAGTPELDITILKFTDGNPDDNPWTGSTDVTSTMKLDFGALTHFYTDTGGTHDAGVWFSEAGYCVVIFNQGFGKKYEVRSTCAGLSGAGGTLPVGGFGITPVYASADEWVYPDGSRHPQGTKPPAAVVGSAGSAVATNKIIYTSEPAPSTARILQAYYGIPPKKAGGADPFPGWTGITLSQASGTYTGTVTISIVAI